MYNMIMRYLTPEILRLLQDEKKMAFVAGPRQVGKTTLVKHLLAEAKAEAGYFNWDVDRHRRLIVKNPEGFWRQAFASARPQHRPRIALDEIHKYPRWKRFLKGFYDDNAGRVDILVTGSGRLDVYQRGGDSLLGRYGLYHLHPFTVGELLHRDTQRIDPPETFWAHVLERPTPAGAAEGLEQVDTFSGFPEPLFAQRDERLRRWRRTRRQLVIREDLRDLSHVRDIGLVESLILLLPERIGSPLSLNALSADLGVAYGTVKHWMETLARLYYLFELRPYAGKLARALRREAKAYLFDLTEIADPGARFENLVALHLLKLCEAWNDWGYGDFSLRYVRNKEKQEVDFLLTQGGAPYALIEAKLSDQRLSPHLLYFRDRLKPKMTIQLVRQADTLRMIPHGQDTYVMAAHHLLACV